MIMLLLSAGILDNNNPSTTIESHMEKVSYQNYF